jgi:hypothetical protein
LNPLEASATIHATGLRERPMFELRTNGRERDAEVVEQARLARNAGHATFQVFARNGARRSSESSDDEFEAARLVDLLESEGWTLENVAHSAEPPSHWSYGVGTARILGTIYTFRSTAAS